MVQQFYLKTNNARYAYPCSNFLARFSSFTYSPVSLCSEMRSWQYPLLNSIERLLNFKILCETALWNSKLSDVNAALQIGQLKEFNGVVLSNSFNKATPSSKIYAIFGKCGNRCGTNQMLRGGGCIAEFKCLCLNFIKLIWQCEVCPPSACICHSYTSASWSLV